MSYDANSPEARKARITENCIREILKKTGCTVERPDGRAEGEANLVDFVVTESYGKKYLVEVKILKRFGYSYGEYPCFTLPVERVNSYVNYAANQGLQLRFYIFEQATRTIWAQWLYILESPRPIGKYTFPFNKNTVKGDKRCYHISQFGDTTFNNYNNVFDQLQAIDDERNAEVASGGTSDCYNPDDFQFDDMPIDIAEDKSEVEQSTSMQSELPLATPSAKMSLNEIIQQLADALKCPVEEVRVAAKDLYCKHHPIINELLSGTS